MDEFERARAQLGGAEEQIGQLRQELAAAGATATGLEARIEDLRRLATENQARLEQLRDEHAAERDKHADRTRLAEQRFADMEKRDLLEIDRERTGAAKLQKALESERAAHATGAERLRTEHNAAMAMIGQLREQVGELQSVASTLDKNATIYALKSIRCGRGSMPPPARLPLIALRPVTCVSSWSGKPAWRAPRSDQWAAHVRLTEAQGHEKAMPHPPGFLD